MQYFKGVPIEKIGYCKCRQQSAISPKTKNLDTGMFAVTAKSHLKTGSTITIIMTEKITTI